MLAAFLCGIILYAEDYIKKYLLCKINIRVYVDMRIFVSFHSKTNKMHQCIKLILFWNDTLYVSDGLSKMN
jgi:hypothetical protein